jgi:Protein of unknown function (DUF3604)
MEKKSLHPLILAAALLGLLVVFFAASALAEYQPLPPDKKIKYSPYPKKDFPNRVFFGDTHLHTTYSTDAGMVGCTLGPEDAYRFARGETVTSSTGVPARLIRPYDFLVVSDHSENLGLCAMIAESNPNLLKNEWGKKVHDLFKAGKGIEAYDLWMTAMNSLKDPLAGNTEAMKSMWERITAAAEKYNQPGLFTAFIGYEWTSMPGGKNLHRNVIFRDGKDKADQALPLSNYDGQDPELLWKWMTNYEKKTGGRVLAIPHNGNLSNGLMFDDVTYTDRKPIDRAYAERRMKWEPLYEVTQIKGDGEAHPKLSPNDEFADFYTWDRATLGPDAKTPDMLPREYAREALKRGLAYEAKLGANPFKFGMVGSTDSHTALSTAREDNFFGKVTPLEPSADPIRFYELITGRKPDPQGRNNKTYAWETAAAGLAAVWSRENTREALWDAMARKEVYATTGTRMLVRVFAGWDFAAADMQRSDFAEHGYAKGVPMGGDLSKAPNGKAPTLMVRVVKDVDGANLDRIQIVKGWLDKDGKTHEKVYDVAWSGDRKPGADGKVPPVGNTVNVKEATYTNAIGAPFLAAFWQDPNFDPKQRAFYYIRVLEIPTPTWIAFDAKVFGVEVPKGAQTVLQERAYTSPIWYTPGS